MAEHGLDAKRLAGLLADGHRRRVIAALILGSATRDDIATQTGLASRELVSALGRLQAAGLVVADAGRYWLVEEAFAAAARRESAEAPQDPFIRDGRLVQVPANRTKRLAVLDRIAQDFEPGVRYSERRVSLMCEKWHDDYAALRRYLVDEGFLERDHGEYWRSGGSVAT